MDDMWSIEVWDRLRFFFPENMNGSRIVVTTRLSQVAVSLGSQNSYLMDFLDEEKSWNLFCIKAFGKEVCPTPELEKIGKNIVEYCRGLPLAITVIGGLLGKSNMTKEDWELVAKDVAKSLDNSKEEEDCSNILSLSYKHLPIHLKPCFLYMRIFPEDSEIDVYNLIDYWIAEGFIKPKGGKSLEEVAGAYLKDLIDRNLLLINQLEPSTGKIWKCIVHDLLRDFCIKEYENEQFFGISKVKSAYMVKDTCFLCCYRKKSTKIDLPQGSCFVCDVCNIMWSHHYKLRVVKADHTTYTYFNVKYYDVHFVVTRLRYLEVDELDSTVIPLLWNLQFFILRPCIVELPFQIWEMPQLRHLDAYNSFYVDPPVTQIGKKDNTVCENLHTVKVSTNLTCLDEFLKRILNLETLEITYNAAYTYDLLNHPFCNFGNLNKLKRLVCTGVNLEHISLPNSLKTLVLHRGNYPWERMTIIGLLPNLQELAIERSQGGPEWNPIEGEFLQLKALCISSHDLVQWNAEKYHFPKLEILRLRKVDLEEIPSGIGEIETLREIQLISCSESLVKSAEAIIEEQRDYGNENLRLILE